jgi:HemY protein
MRALLWLVALAALAVGLSLAARYNDGYVLFVLPPWRLELSLNLLIVIGLAVFAVGHGALRAVSAILGMPKAVRRFRARRAREQADAGLREALRLFYEGRFSHALKCAEGAYDSSIAEKMPPGLPALLALRAAHAMRDPEREALWRERAEAAGADNRAALLMTETELAVEVRRFAEARESLAHLAASEGRHIAALRLALRVEQGLGNWREVLRLVRQLEKHKAMTPEQAAPIRLRAHRENIRALRDDGAALKRYWKAMPAADRLEPRLALDAAQGLAAAGECAEAALVIEDFLDEQWDSSLVAAYAECAGGDTLARIAHGEKWLVAHPRDAQLLCALGRLCRERQLWGKAQSYLEASLAIAPTRACHLELAQLLDHLERTGEADKHYRKAATL